MFLKGAVVGLVCALLGGAAVAFAGSGVGAVFNLGVSNSVNAKTTLTGASPSAQLQVSNTNAAGGAFGLGVTSASSSATGSFMNSSSGIGVSALAMTGTAVYAQSGGAAVPALVVKNTAGGPAASFGVTAGAPFKVSSSTKVANLNADLLDGFDVGHIMTGGGRVAQASTNDLFPNASPTTRAMATLVAPSAGFALVQGSVVAEDEFSSTRCHSCFVSARVHDVSANADSANSFATIGNATDGTFATVPVQWVFPVTAGSHQYTLQTTDFSNAGGPAVVDNPVLTVEFIPFGHAGGPTLAQTEGDNTVATPNKSGRDGASRGTP